MRYLLTILLVLVFVSKIRAGPWPQGKGNGYFQVSFTYLNYDEVINSFTLRNFELFEVYGLKRRVTDHTLNGYLEYGITDKLTFVGVVPFKILKTGEKLLKVENDRFPQDTIASGNLNTLGNVDLGLRYLLYRGKILWSAQIISGLNTASYQHPTGLRSGYDAWYFTPRMQVGNSWGNFYFSASAGVRFKTNGYAHDLISDNEIGYKWDRGNGRKTWIVFTFGAELPITEGQYNDRNSIHTGLYRDEEGFTDPGLKINHYLNEHLAINVSSVGALWGTRHGGNQLTYTAGISWEW